jgi:short-subunit dehydrogenase
MNIIKKNSKTAFIAGATSSLAYAICHQLAGAGWRLILCGRDKDELTKLHADITIRHDVKVEIMIADFASPEFNGRKIIAAAEKKGNSLDALFMVVGEMGDTRFQDGPENIERVARVNYVTPAKLISAAAERMEERYEGDIVVISSVSGDRGRKKNYVYGSSKAALTVFSSGMRSKYAGTGVHVMTVKPGFIDTRGTFAMNTPLMADRKAVARIIIKAMYKKKNLIYVPWFWRYIMLIINNIPEFIFKRLSI